MEPQDGAGLGLGHLDELLLDVQTAIESGAPHWDELDGVLGPLDAQTSLIWTQLYRNYGAVIFEPEIRAPFVAEPADEDPGGPAGSHAEYLAVFLVEEDVRDLADRLESHAFVQVAFECHVFFEAKNITFPYPDQRISFLEGFF